MKFCTHCGSKVNENAVFCTSCGCSLEDNVPKKVTHNISNTKDNTVSSIRLIAILLLALGALNILFRFDFIYDFPLFILKVLSWGSSIAEVLVGIIVLSLIKKK